MSLEDRNIAMHLAMPVDDNTSAGNSLADEWENYFGDDVSMADLHAENLKQSLFPTMSTESNSATYVHSPTPRGAHLIGSQKKLIMFC